MFERTSHICFLNNDVPDGLTKIICAIEKEIGIKRKSVGLSCSIRNIRSLFDSNDSNHFNSLIMAARAAE